MSNGGRQTLRQLREVFGSLCQHDGRTALPGGIQDVTANQPVAALVGDQRVIERMELHADVRIDGGRRKE